MFGNRPKTRKKFPTENVMTSKNAAKRTVQREDQSLDGQYGKIGISAVAAALPYQSEAKNQAYAPVAHRDDNWRAEMMAG
jgi:hypothetical protein